MTADPKGRGLFIVDNSVSGWTGLRYLEEWAGIAKAFDIATGYFEIGALLALDGQWQSLDNIRMWVCTSLPTTPHLVVGRSACRVGVGPSLNRSWAQRSRPVVQAGRRAFPGDESVVD